MKRKQLQSLTVGKEGEIFGVLSPTKKKRTLLKGLKIQIGGVDSNVSKQNKMVSDGITGSWDITTTIDAKKYIDRKNGSSQNEDLIVVDHILWAGSTVRKIPFHTVGTSKQRTIRLKRGIYGGARTKVYVRRSSSVGKLEVVSAASPLCLELCDPNKAIIKASSDLPIEDIVEIKEGCQTPAFYAFTVRNGQVFVPDTSRCFSIVHEKRTFDLYAETRCITKCLIDAIHEITRQLNICAKTLIDESYSTLSNYRKPSASQLDQNRFFDAIVAGDKETFRWFLDNEFHVDIMKNDETRDTALISACRVGKINIVQIALQYAAKNDPHPNFGSTALQVAVSSGHLQCAQLILEAAAVSGADSTIANHEDSNKDAPIHVAARCGSHEIVALLVSHGANTNLINFHGRTCLHCSAMQGRDTCLQYLLDIGCDSLLEERDDQGMTCLHLAVTGGRVECAKILIKRGSKINTIIPGGSSIFQIAQQQASQKMLRALSAYTSQTSTQCLENETYPSDLNSNWFVSETVQPTMFDGLDVFQVSGKKIHVNDCDEYLQATQSNPLGFMARLESSQNHLEDQQSQGYEIEQKSMSDKSILAYSSSHISNYDSSVGTSKNSVCHNTNTSCDERYQSTELPLNCSTLNEKRFKVGNDWWYVCYSSGYPYYLSSRDNCCQWQDPRLQRNHVPELTKNSVTSTIESTPVKEYVKSESGEVNKENGCETISVSSNGIAFDEYLSTKSPATKLLCRLRERQIQAGGNVESSEVSIQSYSKSHREDGNISRCSNISQKKLSLPKIPLKTNHCNQSTHTNLSQNMIYRETCGSLATRNTNMSTEIAIENHVGECHNERQKLTKDSIEKVQPNIQVEAYCPIKVSRVNTKTVVRVKVTDGHVQENIASCLPTYDILQSEIDGESCDSKYSNNTKMIPTQSDVERTQNEIVHENIKRGSCSSNDIASGLPSCDRSQKDINIDACTDSQINAFIKISHEGIPTQSVANKMHCDEVNKNEIVPFESSITSGCKCIVPGPHRCHELKKDNEVHSNTDSLISKYVKMVQVGVPIQSTINKMHHDGVDMKRIDHFKLTYACTKNVIISSAPTSDILHELPKINLQNDSLLSKYVNMVQVGVPAQSVVSKMHHDGVASAKVQAFETSYGLGSKQQKKKCAPYIPTDLPVPQLHTNQSRRTSITMQKIHWKIVSEEKLPDSLWAEHDGGECDIDDNEIEELENLFGAKSTPALFCKKRNEVQETCRTKLVPLIEFKRANNIAISLAQFRSFHNYDDLCKAVVSLDMSKLTIEKLQNMQKLLPSSTELAALKQYKGGVDSLGRAESFFLAESKFPSFPQKLDAFVFTLQFSDVVHELKTSSSLLIKACIETVDNKMLSGILRRILAVGNLMNEGAGKPRARGITMDSLLETVKKKGSDGRTSVLDHVVVNVLKQNDTDKCIDFWEELKNVEAAANIDVQSCKISFDELKFQIENLKSTIKVKTSCLEGSINSGVTDIFLNKINNFLKNANKDMIELDLIFKEVNTSFDLMCSFFAEDKKSCQASTIFKVLLNLAKLVETSKKSWLHKQQSERRRSAMSTPIKKVRVKLPEQITDTTNIDRELSAQKKSRSIMGNLVNKRRNSFASNFPE